MAASVIPNLARVRYGTNQEDNGILILLVSGTPSNGTLSVDLSGYGKSFKYNAIACPTSTSSIYVTGAYVENNVLKIRSNATALTQFNVLLSYHV